MAFTPQQEAEILRAVRTIAESERRRLAQDSEAAMKFIRNAIGLNIANNLLNNYGWPTLHRKFNELMDRL